MIVVKEYLSMQRIPPRLPYNSEFALSRVFLRNSVLSSFILVFFSLIGCDLKSSEDKLAELQLAQSKKSWDELADILSWKAFDRAFSRPTMIAGIETDYASKAGLVFRGADRVVNKQYSYYSDLDEWLVYQDAPVSWVTETGRIENLRINYAESTLRKHYTPIFSAKWNSDDGIATADFEVYPVTKGENANKAVVYQLSSSHWSVWAVREVSNVEFSAILNAFEKVTGKVNHSEAAFERRIPARAVMCLGEFEFQFRKDSLSFTELLNRLVLYPNQDEDCNSDRKIELQLMIDDHGNLESVAYDTSLINGEIRLSLQHLSEYLLQPDKMDAKYIPVFNAAQLNDTHASSKLKVKLTIGKTYCKMPRCNYCLARFDISKSELKIDSKFFCSDYCRSTFLEQESKFYAYNGLDINDTVNREILSDKARLEAFLDNYW